MHTPEKRYTFCYEKKKKKKKKHLRKKKIHKYIIYRRDVSKNLQNKIDNLDKKQQAKLAKYISKLEKEKQLTKLISKKKKKQVEPKKTLTKSET